LVNKEIEIFGKLVRQVKIRNIQEKEKLKYSKK